MNFIGPNTKLISIIGGASTLIVGGLYASGTSTIAISSMVAAPAIILTLGVTYFSKNIIEYSLGAKSIKCANNHPLKLTAKAIIESYDGFKGLNYTDIFIYKAKELNAFACGFNKKKSAIYISQSLISKLGNDYSNKQLKAIIAHELGHIAGGHFKIDTAVKTLDIVGDVFVTYLADKLNNATNYEVPNNKTYTPEKIEKEKQSLLYQKIVDGCLWFCIKSFQKIGLAAISRQLEYQADNMAVKCGLGRELMKALVTISDDKPISNSYSDGIISYWHEIGSTHPSTINRLIAINTSIKEKCIIYNNKNNFYKCVYDSIKYSFARLALEHTSHFNQLSILNELLPEDIPPSLTVYENDKVENYFYNSVNNLLDIYSEHVI